VGYACGTGSSCISPAASTTAGVIVPGVRPTGGATTTSTTAPTTTTTSHETAAPPTTTYTTGTQLVAVCPTGYYFCSDYYRPGCCRIGRDCAMTDCPAAASSSTLAANGVTIAVPVGASTGGLTYTTTGLVTQVAGATGCPAGWNPCGAAVGGGCCPAGFACGVAQCSAGTSVVSKIAAGAAAAAVGRGADVVGWAVVALGAVFGAAMVLL
jgi:hypothetical protein